MIARYVHVEVRELRRRVGEGRAEAECLVILPTGEKASLVAQLYSRQAPFWRVVSYEEFGDPFIGKAVDLIGEDALCDRIATAAAFWNVWDSIRAKD